MYKTANYYINALTQFFIHIAEYKYDV